MTKPRRQDRSSVAALRQQVQGLISRHRLALAEVTGAEHTLERALALSIEVKAEFAGRLLRIKQVLEGEDTHADH
jgi:hypothetical protein